MSARGRLIGWAGALLLAAVGSGCAGQPAPAAPRVTINGRSWRVELAMTAEQRYRGLSDRRRLDPNAGMLFVYPSPQVLEFCMRQCLVPLDVAFIDADLRVRQTHTMPVEPYGLDRAAYSSKVPVQYALEVPAGALAEAGVKVGDKVGFSPEVPPAAKAEPGL
jgi:hypothetical protein